jgi:ribosomal protein L2
MALNSKEKELRRRKAGQGSLAQNITKSDSSTYDSEFNIYVGTGGNLKIDTTDGQTITLKNIPSGTYIDWIKAKKIYNKGTTASDIIAIY